MYAVGQVRRRWFDLKLENGRVLQVKPPKIKVLRQLEETVKAPEGETIGQLLKAASRVLSNNRQGCKLSPEKLEEMFDLDELYDLLHAYMAWLSEEHEKN